jgi:ABC-type glycerol-3-phosphate transport system substrate-binding protein
MKVKRRWLALASLAVLATTTALFVATTGGASPQKASGSITVWVDAPRLPVAKLYAKTHPNVHLKLVTYDGDGNGASTMQTKIQLWNRTGKGWPDVVFSEQANDPVWMGQKPFDFALDLKGIFPANLLKGWPAPSLAQCTVNGRLVCLQDNLAPEVLYVNQKLMKQFGYTVPKTWQQWATLGAKVAKEHPGYIIGNVGDSYGHWLYLWADKCPISQVVGPKTVRINAGDVHCTRMAQLLDPLIKSGVVPPVSVFTADFATKYGGDNDKILLMPGPVWYAKDIFSGTLHVPAGELTAALPLRWNNEPLVTGQVGGGPWIVSRHTKNQAAAVDFVKWVTTTNQAKTVAPGRPA